MTDRVQLRAKYREIRKNIPDKEFKDLRIFALFKVLLEQFRAKSFFTYVSLAEEVDTIAIIKYFLGKYSIGVPKISGKEMSVAEFLPEDFANISADKLFVPPDERIILPNPKVVVVPIVVGDRKCNRYGFGGGYYDRFIDKNMITIGLAYEAQLVKQLDINEFDKPLNYIVTEEDIIERGVKKFY